MKIVKFLRKWLFGAVEERLKAADEGESPERVMTYGDKPFGLRDVKLTNIAGDTQVDLPASRTLGFSEQMSNGELRVCWSLEAGGISLEAYALLTGRTITKAGATPNQTMTLTGSAEDEFPYIKIYGKSLGAGDDDIHCKFFKVRVTSLEGSFGQGKFFVTSCSGEAKGDKSNRIFEFVQNETARDLPSS